MADIFVEAQNFGKIRFENGFVPVPTTYPGANERIFELFTQRHEAMVEVMKGLRANMMATEVGVDPVSTFAADDTEATAQLESIRDEFHSPESMRELFAPILEAYIDSSDEGPVAVAMMPPISEFHS
jgi:hypothetical protein